MHAILVVENDHQLAQLLHTLLHDEGKLLCHVASSIEQALICLDKQQYDLLILDRVLEDGDGLEVAQFAQEESPTTKILVLSKKCTVQERVMGLEKGCDDYMSKPFSSAELKLKVKKLLVMQKQDMSQIHYMRGISINISTGTITHAQYSGSLRKKELYVFLHLMRHQNQVVARQDLIRSIWLQNGLPAPSEVSLDVYIRRIRQALKMLPLSIQTARGYGFKLVPTME